jgi:hypothetical protein
MRRNGSETSGMRSELIVCLVMCLAGCAARSPVSPNIEVYQRAGVILPEADLLKPKEVSGQEAVFGLAPFIFHQTAQGPMRKRDNTEDLDLVSQALSSEGGEGSPTEHTQSDLLAPGPIIGALTESNGMVSVDMARPAIYFDVDTVEIKGRTHGRISFLWFYATQEGRPRCAQGVRLTMDVAGLPAIWEILSDNSGLNLIFVSQRVEAAAVGEFGKPLPMRRFAIERSRADAPRAVVPRAIDDGPVPMGPMLYLEGRTPSVVTLTCRCMPVQAASLATTRTYELLPFRDATNLALLSRARTLIRNSLAFWPDEKGSDNRLEKCLRLPAEL